MPILIVLGVPKKQQSSVFINALKQRVYDMVELKLTKPEVSVIFLGDASDEIIIFIEGLFDKPERTEAIRQTLAQRVALCCKRHMPDANTIECFVKPFDPTQGFYSLSR